MKKPVFLILIGIGVLLLVGGVVFVVPWFGKMLDEMEQIAELHRQHRRALKMSAREPLTDEQEKLLSQLLEIVSETDVSQSPNDLEGVLSSEPYLAYLKVQEGADHEDFPSHI
jgi:flagellar basal body-associated protein FliL